MAPIAEEGYKPKSFAESSKTLLETKEQTMQRQIAFHIEAFAQHCDDKCFYHDIVESAPYCIMFDDWMVEDPDHNNMPLRHIECRLSECFPEKRVKILERVIK